MVVRVLDTSQLARIQASHRGFLYQHLFAVACILKLHSRSAGEVRVERDEDVEICDDDITHYIQVKNLSSNLVFSDIKGALERFAALRSVSGERERGFQFHIVSSSEPGPDLAKRIENANWPADVVLHTPILQHSEINFPGAAENVGAMLAVCRDSAAQLPFTSLDPATLVWKLAALVQFAASGEDPSRPGHVFSRSELHDLFELLVRQLQDFAVVPDDYHVQLDEPELESEQRIRLLVGFSGAGKTLWASRQARHSAAPTAYYDLNILSGGAAANSIARELAARFLTGVADGSAVLPSGSGVEMLRAICANPNLSRDSILVLDNVQRADTEVLEDILEACSPIRMVCLAQPWPGQAPLAAKLGIEVEQLKGWDSDTVAAEFARECVTISPALAKCWREITGGLPLYVRSAATLCKSEFGGDANLGMKSVSDQTHIGELAQEVLLERALDHLPDYESSLLAALSLSRVPLTKAEVGVLLGNTMLADIPVRNTMRRLMRRGFLELSAGGTWKVHDALWVSAQTLAGDFPSELLMQLRVNLRDLLFVELRARRDLSRMAAWMRLLGPTGRTDILADIAGSEMFLEIGDPSDLKDVLREEAYDQTSQPELRFWALDALAFWELQEDRHVSDPEPALLQLEELMRVHAEFGNRERAAVAMKRMLLHGKNGDLEAIARTFSGIAGHLASDPVMDLIVRYNYATALWVAGAFKECLRIALAVAKEYLQQLSLDPLEMVGTNPVQLRAMLPCNPGEIQDELKRLADTMELISRAKRSLNMQPFPECFHAAKLYQEAGAHKSQMKVSQDIADDMVAMGDYEGALEMMEGNVLPILSHFELTAHTMDVRGQYAVVLAYNGAAARARAEMDAIRPYVPNLPEDYKKGFENQCAMIEDLVANRVCSGHQNPSVLPVRSFGKVGRNDRCPCGSGKKYKKCCGA